MSLRTRVLTMAGIAGAFASALALGGGVANASPATAQVSTAPAAHASAAKPASPAYKCGFVWSGFDGQGIYNNCSPFSVEIRIEWWFSSDTYACVGANSSDVLNAWDTQSPSYAVFDGRTNC